MFQLKINNFLSKYKHLRTFEKRHIAIMWPVHLCNISDPVHLAFRIRFQHLIHLTPHPLFLPCSPWAMLELPLPLCKLALPWGERLSFVLWWEPGSIWYWALRPSRLCILGRVIPPFIVDCSHQRNAVNTVIIQIHGMCHMQHTVKAQSTNPFWK